MPNQTAGTDNGICHKLSNGSVIMAENNKLYANAKEDQKENCIHCIHSGIIDIILLYYLTITDNEIDGKKNRGKNEKSNTQKEKNINSNKIKMDLLPEQHDRQQLFAFVFCFDLNEKYVSSNNV